MEKQNQIIPLFDLPDSSELLTHFQNLIFQKKYAEAISFGKRKFKNGSASHTYYTGLSICYSELNKPKEALKILAKAESLFPDNADVYYYRGIIHLDLENFEESENCLLRSLELSPSNNRIERSECLNNLGVLYWNDFRREEALDFWKDAVNENPFNDKAQENLKEFSNEYGEPKTANQLFDDLYHFQNIHKKKYFELNGKADFSSLEEAEVWTEISTQKWNELIEAKFHDIESMTPAQKTELFDSINIDYSSINKGKKAKKNSKKSSAQKNISFQKGFSFLDEELLFFLPLTVPILSLSSLTEERLKKIANGAIATDEEIELFLWAYDFIKSIIESTENINTIKKKNALLQAKQIAMEILDEADADQAISMTTELFNDLFGNLSSLKLNKRLR